MGKTISFNPELIILILFGILLSALMWIKAIQNKKIKSRESLNGFMECLSVGFHQTMWSISPVGISKESRAKLISETINDRIVLGFQLMINDISIFPEKYLYPLADDTTRMFTKKTYIVLKELHARYKNSPSSLDNLQLEFIQKMEELILTLI